MGPRLVNRAPPMPDVRHGPTMLHGCLLRFCKDPPKHKSLAGLERYVQAYCEKTYRPLSVNCDLTQEHWLDGAPYPLHRKQELLKTWLEKNGCLSDKDLGIDLHGKNETYPMFKPARGINSRKDMFKCYSGPVFHMMEEEVYKDPAFIKHVPVRLRPGYIVAMLGAFPGPYYETDYKQFEKHFTKEVMMAIEMVLYRHMLKHFPAIYKNIERAMTGKNKCTGKHFRIDIQARRMSGEMCTSLGNGFSNLMLAKYIAHTKGGEATGVVEGDDALLFSSVPLTEDDFMELGFEIKMKVHNDLLRTSFCGLIMSADLCTMTDPRKVLLNIGWSHSLQMLGGPRVRAGLLRAKALSLAYEHPRCPILSVLATTLLEHTTGHKPIFDRGFYRAQLHKEVIQFSEETGRLLKAGPSLQCRHDFAEQFHISISTQLEVEAYLRSYKSGPLDHPAIERLYDVNGMTHCATTWSTRQPERLAPSITNDHASH